MTALFDAHTPIPATQPSARFMFPRICRIFALKFLFAEAAKVPSLTYSREPCILC